MTDENPNSSPANPGYSVLIVVYDRDEPIYVDECLGSVAEQSWPADEIVVLLVGNINEGLAGVLKAWQARLPIVQVSVSPDLGFGSILAHGMLQCRCEFVVHARALDVSQPWRVERQVGFLQQNPHLDLCGSCMWEVDPQTTQPQTRLRVPESDTAISAMLPYRNPFNLPTMVVRREKVLACGNYVDLPYSEDYHLWMRMLGSGSRGWNLQDDLVLGRSRARFLPRQSGVQRARTEYHLYRTRRRYRLGNPLSDAMVFVVRAASALLSALVPDAFSRLRHN